jgi:voltage-gated sodium channel
LFDFVIIAIALVPAAQSFSVLRALRVMRVLRVLSTTPRLRRVVEGFLAALPGMGSVFVLTAIFFYIGSVMATKLFGDAFPQWFGDMGMSAYSLFQIMTLESWSMGIVRPVMEVYPMAWAFFIPFILATAFVVMNLLIGLIVNSMQDAHSEEDEEKTGDYRVEVLERLANVEVLLKDLQKK